MAPGASPDVWQGSFIINGRVFLLTLQAALMVNERTCELHSASLVLKGRFRSQSSGSLGRGLTGSMSSWVPCPPSTAYMGHGSACL